MTDGPNILLSVGDDSGDTHAAHLMRAIRSLAPAATFAGFGMARMAAAGLQPLHDEDPGGSVMWLSSLLRAGHYRRRLAVCRRYLQERRADLVVPVDFGGFNLCLCRAATQLGLPVFYYIPPQVWAHGTYRLKKLRKWTSRAGLIYPFEEELYRRWGVEAEYVGHPMFDELEANPPDETAVAMLKERFGPTLVGVFPGSRRQEIAAHMPVLAEACRRIRTAVPDAAFAVRATRATRDFVDALARRAHAPVEVLDEGVRSSELARASALCITKSGTVTLEIAAQGTPMVIIYKASPAIAFLAYGLSRSPYVGLVNTLAGRMICPEKPAVRVSPAWMADQALRLLRDPAALQAQRDAIHTALDGFIRPGASQRAARSALSLIGEAR